VAGTWVCLPYSKVYAQSRYLHTNTLSDLRLVEQSLKNKLDERVWELRNQAQGDAELYAKTRFGKWVNNFQSRLGSSGFLNWYFSYFVNKSTDDRELLCNVSHFIPLFPTSRSDCNIFIQEAQTQLIKRVFKPIEGEVDDISNRSLGVFYNTLSRLLHNEFKELRQDYTYKALPRETWKKIENDLASVVPGFRGESLPAPPPIYLSLVKGRSPGEDELLVKSEIGEVVFKIPSLFQNKADKTYREAPKSGSAGSKALRQPSKEVLSKATPQVAEMEQLGFDTAELAIATETGEMLGMSRIKLQALADPIFWVPIVLLEGKRYLDLSNSKESSTALLGKELADVLREHIDTLVEDEDTGLRAIFERINIRTISPYLYDKTS